jgi:general secretion pathway protein D
VKFRFPRLAQLWLLLLCSAMVGAQTATPSRTAAITPNFQNVDILVVAEAVGAATGVTFIPDPRVRANVTLINPRPMTPQQLYFAFLSILQVHNFAASREGNVVKIVPDANVRTLPGNDMPENMNMGGDEMVTTVLEARNISPLQLSQVLRQFVAQYGQLLPVPGTNSMIITDRASNVRRIQKILARVDQSSNSSVDVIPLENAVASEVVRLITALTTGQPADAAGGSVPRVIADDRTNSVMVSGDPAQRLRIATWVDSLDAPGKDGGGTRVLELKYAKAEDLAAVLKAQISGATATTGATGGAATASAAAIADRSVTILADKQTNKLIITAPPRTMLSLMTIINELDVPLKQVFIEAIIADVSDSQAADLGVNWAVYSNENGTNVPAGGFISPVGSGNGNPVSIVDLAQTIANPASATSVPLGATFGIGRLSDNGINLGVMVRALRSDGNTNVISYPNVTATNNVESELKSAQEVPFISGQFTNTGTGTGGGGGGSVNPFTTVNRQEVGTILKVTPQIIPGNGEVILNIDLESSELSGTAGDAGSLITNKRSVKTSVRVQSGSTIVIGGMMRDSKVTGETGVPYLRKIPLLGELFKTRNGKRGKSTLMIFIQPRVLNDAVQTHAETSAKYDDIRDMQRLQNNHREILPLLPFDNPPELPVLPLPLPPVSAPPAGAPANP